jgi:hypothetical protein
MTARGHQSITRLASTRKARRHRPARPFRMGSGTLVDAPLIRPAAQPTPQDGLLKPSQIQIDKAISVLRHRVGGVVGRLDDASMLAVTRSLALFLGIA